MKLHKFIIPVLLCTIITSCKKSDFVKANTDPNVLYKVDPADQFQAAAQGSQDDFEYYYDVYRDLMPWLQYSTPLSGNGFNFTGVGSNFNYRYRAFYTRIGAFLSDIPVLISKMTPQEQKARAYEQAIASSTLR